MAWRWIRVGAVEAGVTLKRVSDEAKIPYDVFTKVINGYRRAPEGFADSVKKAFDRIRRRSDAGVAVS